MIVPRYFAFFVVFALLMLMPAQLWFLKPFKPVLLAYWKWILVYLVMVAFNAHWVARWAWVKIGRKQTGALVGHIVGELEGERLPVQLEKLR